MKNDDLWKAPVEVMTEVQNLIAHYHPHLALVDKQIAVLFRAKAAKSGGQPVFGKSYRAPKFLKALGPDEYEFVLEIAADEWSTMTNEQHTALLDRLLCACKVEEDEETHDIKCSVAPPDVTFYYDELKRHGNWMPRQQEAEGPAVDIESKISGTEAQSSDD